MLTKPIPVTFVIILGILLFLGTGGCTRTPLVTSTHTASRPAVSRPFVPGVLRIPLVTEPITLDPAQLLDVGTLGILQQVYEGLLGIGDNNQVVPILAEKMPDISADGIIYTFRLRHGIHFTNGLPVTAQDVKYSMTRELEPALGSGFAMSVLDDIAGAKEVNEGKTKELSGVTVVDDRTVRIRLVGSRPCFLSKLTLAYIVCQSVVEQAPKNAVGARLIDAAHSVGTGPFRLAEYQRQQHVTLVANPDYWGGKPALTRIELPIILDMNTVRNLYDTGQLDIIPITAADYGAAISDPSLKEQVRYTDRAQIFFAQLSQKQFPPFRDRRVRQALALATDREAVLQTVRHGSGVVADGLLPPGMPGYSPTFKGFPHDVARATRLLAEAGYTKDRPLPPFTLVYVEKIPDVGLVAQMLREQWAEAGITVNLQEREWGALLTLMEHRDYDASLSGLTSAYPDPQGNISDPLRAGSPSNMAGYDNPRFNQLCDAANTEKVPTTRSALYLQAMRIAVDDAPVIPLYFWGDTELISPHVHGLRESLFGRLPHTRTTVQ